MSAPWQQEEVWPTRIIGRAPRTRQTTEVDINIERAIAGPVAERVVLPAADSEGDAVDVLIDRQGEMAAVDDHEEVADDLADLVVRLSQEELPSGFGKELPLGFTGSWNCTKKSTPSIRGEKTFFYLRCEAEAAPIEDGAAFASGLEDAKYWQEMRTHSSSPTITGFCRRGSRLRGSVCPTGTVNACAAALAAAVGQGARQLAFSAALVAAKLLFAHPGTQGLADRVRLESYGR